MLYKVISKLKRKQLHKNNINVSVAIFSLVSKLLSMASND